MAALHHVDLVLVLRLGPFAVHVVLASVRLLQRIIILVAYAAGVAWLVARGGRQAVVWMLAGVAYFLAVAGTLDGLATAIRQKRLSRGGLFLVLFFAFLLLPGMLAPEVAPSLFLVVGWDLMLSGYSYCVDTAHARTQKPSLSDRLFFLFVNPTLVYSRRGEPIADSSRCHLGLWRALFGATLLFGKNVAGRLVDSAVPTPHAAGLAGNLIYGAIGVLLFYAAHSGLAHLQIGLMRAIGWRVPERYEYPLFARNPVDFWRRWNTYVRTWLEAYIFLPSGIAMARRTRNRWSPLAAGVLALLVSGLIHDAFDLAGHHRLSLRYTILYVGAALVWSAWRVAVRLTDAIRASAPPGLPQRWMALTSSCFSRAALVGLLVVAALHLR